MSQPAKNNLGLNLSQRRTVFVVDDDAGIRNGIRRLLRAHDLDAEVFESAESFEQRLNVEGALCLVLDINLNGTSGLDLRRRMTASGSSLPVIFITGDSNETTHSAALASGCVAYLTKPVAADILMAAIAKAADA